MKRSPVNTRDGRQVVLMDFTREEESNIANVSMLMLATPRRWLRITHWTDFIDDRFWNARGQYGSAISEEEFVRWFDAVEEWGLEDLAPHMTRLEAGWIGLKHGDASSLSDMIQFDAVKSTITKIWHGVWQSHPIRRSSERYKSYWVDPYLDERREIRIMKAIMAEERLKSVIEAEIAKGALAPELCRAYCEDHTRGAEAHLDPSDYSTWIERAPEISKQIGVPAELLRSRVTETKMEIDDEDEDE